MPPLGKQSSVNYYAQTCIFDALNGSLCTKFATSESLRCIESELYAFRSDITTMHKSFGQRITASRALKKYGQKSRKFQEMALSMFSLLDWSSTVKCKTVRITWQAATSMAGFEKFWFLSSGSVRDSRHLMWPFENSWWLPGRKEINFPC